MKHERNGRALARARGLAAVAVGAWLGAAPAPAQEAAPEAAPVGLDRLLRLPQGLEIDASVSRKGGATRSEWMERFAEARGDLASARAALDETRAEMQEIAGDTTSWSISAPGATPDPDAIAGKPLDYSLSKELAARREEVERSERRLRELQVEANLAGVPPEWQAAAEEPPTD